MGFIKTIGSGARKVSEFVRRKVNAVAVALATGIVAASTASAAEGDFDGLSSVSTQVTSWSNDIKAILGIAFGITVVVVAFSLGRKFLRKSA